MSVHTPLNGQKIAVILASHDHAKNHEICNKLREFGADLTAVSVGTDGMPEGLEVGKSMNVQLADPTGFESLLIIADEREVASIIDKPEMGAFALSFFLKQKPVAAYAAGVNFLADLGVLEGRNVSSESTLEAHPNNGAIVGSAPMTTDNGLTTAVSSVSAEEFALKVAEEVKEGRHQGQHV